MYGIPVYAHSAGSFRTPPTTDPEPNSDQDAFFRATIERHSEVSEIKRNIQALLRDTVIDRDGGCILRNMRLCGCDIGCAALQADHLITRANSATYADPRLVVCVCRPCHAWKSLGGNLRKAQHDALVRTILSPERVALTCSPICPRS